LALKWIRCADSHALNEMMKWISWDIGFMILSRHCRCLHSEAFQNITAFLYYLASIVYHMLFLFYKRASPSSSECEIAIRSASASEWVHVLSGSLASIWLKFLITWNHCWELKNRRVVGQFWESPHHSVILRITQNNAYMKWMGWWNE